MKQTFQSVMLRKSIGSMESHRSTCSHCGRTPLVGEFLYRLDADALCGLCVTSVPEDDRAPLEPERVHAGERGLPVARRVA